MYCVCRQRKWTVQHLKTDCTIPVFAKDNERTISHQEFIESAMEAIEAVFGRNTYLQPEIRVSHTIKGRTPDAIHMTSHQVTKFVTKEGVFVTIQQLW
ncbi:MAG: DUF3871 family protein [Sediminibacterium sp.]|nr:DUF3871 family protein [Sediminibacterium sp.]